MRLGLSYDARDDIEPAASRTEDALEEYDSKETVGLIAASLEAGGHTVVKLDGGREFLRNIQSQPVDFVFNIAEGRGNYPAREAQVPSVLEMLGIPYSGSDPLCLSICLDKALAKKLAALDGVPTPRWRIINSPAESLDGFRFPVIIKPSCEGSSKGIRLSSLAENRSQAAAEIKRITDDYKQPVMVEEFIAGDEVTVGITGNSPPLVLGMMRIVPRTKDRPFVYSLEVKRDYKNLVDYECPARLDAGVLTKLEAASLQVFKTLRVRDFARVDFRIGPDGTPYFIEINPLPGLGNHSDLVIMAQMLGWTHRKLVNTVLDAAIARYAECVPAS
jgi:D-alanine-D-alanine ligase